MLSYDIDLGNVALSYDIDFNIEDVLVELCINDDSYNIIFDSFQEIEIMADIDYYTR